jgi:molecular chaperone DnaK
LIDKNTTIPTKATQVFSTADNSQTAVTVHVLQGEREMASANKSLGRFDLTDIPPAPRGVPQIEVMFDIDANGILHVSAKDKATGKQQSIVIKASSGLSEEEIKRMVRDAEEHKEADKKFHELVDARNKADNIIHASTKTLSELGSEVSEEEKTKIEAAIEELKAALKQEDRQVIEQKTEALTEVSGKMAERLYAKKGAESAAKPDGGAAGDATGQGGDGGATQQKSGNENVVDAEFEEVKEDKDKK